RGGAAARGDVGRVPALSRATVTATLLVPCVLMQHAVDFGTKCASRRKTLSRPHVTQRHAIWLETWSGVQSTLMDSPDCGKCASRRTRVSSWSVSPEMAFLECADCGHTTAMVGPGVRRLVPTCPTC